MNGPLWSPTSTQIASAQITAFIAEASKISEQVVDYPTLHRWSRSDPGAFWQLVWNFADIIASRTATAAVEDLQAFPGARWFPGSRLNFAENLLRYDDDVTALISVRETGDRTTISYAELRRQTAAVAAHLSASGVAKGDRVAAWLPNTTHTIIAMLATASLGAVFSSCSPDFGALGALDRFGQITPKVLFACDGYSYNGKSIENTEKVDEVVSQVESITQVIWVSLIDRIPEGGTDFDSIIETAHPPVAFTPCAFDDPLYIMYSSGTTGMPKCIVHSVGGTLIQHLKEHKLHVDITRKDTVFYFTTCGWMMWNWLVSSLACGATVVLYEGAPFHPGPQTLFDLAESEQITVFGVSAKFLSSAEKAGVKPVSSHDLSRVRTILSTGSALTHEGFRYVYRDVQPHTHLASISGGTDLISCFVLGNPLGDVWEGEIQTAGLGMAVEVWDDEGCSVVGEKGELVCTQPFPSCPIGFWNDPDDEKFLDAYFRRFPGVWAHGDFAEVTRHDGYIIYGRSDAVLNPGGVRIGTSEIYRQVEQLDQIREAICVGQEWQDDTRVVLFVAMQPGYQLNRKISDEIRNNIRSQASPRHVPARIIEVADIPRTLSGKIVELAVQNVIHNRPVENLSALANPEALELFRDLPELAG